MILKFTALYDVPWDVFGVPFVALIAKSPMKNEMFDLACFCSVPI